MKTLESGFSVKNSVEKYREREKEDIWRPQAAGGENRKIKVNPEITCSFLKIFSAVTCTRFAPLDRKQSLQIVLHENHQIALFSASFVPTSPSPIQYNSRPVMTRKRLGRLKKDSKTN